MTAKNKPFSSKYRNYLITIFLLTFLVLTFISVQFIALNGGEARIKTQEDDNLPNVADLQAHSLSFSKNYFENENDFITATFRVANYSSANISQVVNIGIEDDYGHLMHNYVDNGGYRAGQTKELSLNLRPYNFDEERVELPYLVKAKADYWNEIDEAANENNNESNEVPFYGFDRPPEFPVDLKTGHVSINPNYFIIGDNEGTVDVIVEVINDELSAEPAGNFRVGIYDDLNQFIENFTVDRVYPGMNHTETVRLDASVLNHRQDPAPYYLHAVVDLDNDITEFDENNNDSIEASIDFIEPPDLIVHDMRFKPADIESGYGYVVDADIINQGPDELSSETPIPVSLYIKPNGESGEPTDSEYFVAFTMLNGIGAGETRTATIFVRKNQNDLPLGMHMMAVVVDKDNNLYESNDENNSKTGFVKVVDISESRVNLVMEEQDVSIKRDFDPESIISVTDEIIDRVVIRNSGNFDARGVVTFKIDVFNFDNGSQNRYRVSKRVNIRGGESVTLPLQQRTLKFAGQETVSIGIERVAGFENVNKDDDTSFINYMIYSREEEAR